MTLMDVGRPLVQVERPVQDVDMGTEAALELDVYKRQGLIFHSDRGVQYAAAAFRKRLAALGIRQSMSRKGDSYDNAVAGHFFSRLKCELIHALCHQSQRTDWRIRPSGGLPQLGPATFHTGFACSRTV